MVPFHSVSILLPVIDEAQSLKKTIEIIEDSAGSDIAEYIIIVCDQTSSQSILIIEEQKKILGDKLILLKQTHPSSGGAIIDGFKACRGSHVIMMASDLETNPWDIPRFIELAKQNPDDIITASRWLDKSSFIDYGLFKKMINILFQKTFCFLYNSNLTDITFAYSLFPSILVKSIRWEEYGHSLFLESLLKPLRLGVHVREIPSCWKARTEGVSHSNILSVFRYILIGVKIRFYSERKIKK